MLCTGACLGRVKESVGAAVAAEETGERRDEVREVPSVSTIALHTGWDPRVVPSKSCSRSGHVVFFHSS